MKHLTGSASARTRASAEQCLELLGAIEGYPRWFPSIVREVTPATRDPEGRTATARVALQVSLGPFNKRIEMTLSVDRGEPGVIRLARVGHGGGDRETFDVLWRVDDGPQTTIDVALEAELDGPRLVPVTGAGDAIASRLARAAVEQLERP
jgi:hypothetical protein